MITLTVTRTGKSASPRDAWTRYDENHYNFLDIKDAKDWLADEYRLCKKRVPCYRDVQGSAPIQSGYIYCFKVKEEGKTHYEQHWVSFWHVDSKPIDVRKGAYEQVSERRRKSG